MGWCEVIYMSWRDIVRKGDCGCDDCNKKRFEKQLFEKKGAKPDYIDLDKDGNTTESMKEAARDAEKKAEEEPEFDEYGYPNNAAAFKVYYKQYPKAQKRDKEKGLGLYGRKYKKS